ncbi:MAG: hypothetical protein ABSH38_18935 [Verrucomicrobiota bacterium]|jgi:hypothetical protein
MHADDEDRVRTQHTTQPQQFEYEKLTRKVQGIGTNQGVSNRGAKKTAFGANQFDSAQPTTHLCFKPMSIASLPA